MGQTFSSGSNFLLTVLVLGTATEAEFATFSITSTSFLLVVLMSRALVSVPVLILYSERGTQGPLPRGYRSAMGVALATGLVASVAMVVAAFATGPFLVGAEEQFLLLAAFTPVLVLQDNTRHLAFAEGRPAVAAVSDGSWIALQLAGSAALYLSGHASALLLMAAWAVAGGLAWVIAAVALAASPTLEGALAWLRTNRILCRGLVLELVSTAGSYYVLYYGLAIVAGAEQLGRLKAAQTLFGPVIVVLLGGTALGVPESVRAGHDPRRLRRFAVVLSLGLAGSSLVVGALLFIVLPAFGPTIFPDAWASARPLIPLLSLYAAALGASVGALSGLRAMGASGWIVRARSAAGVVLVGLGLPASAAWGANGALLVLAVTETAVFAAAWVELSRRVGERSPGDD